MVEVLAQPDEDVGHQQHAAADTTFVQFYPTLLPVATKLGTLNPSYVAETAKSK